MDEMVKLNSKITKMPKKQLTPEEEIDLIRGKLKHFKLEWTPSVYLKTGSKRLNGVLGIRELGVPGGKCIEISGPESNGKTGLALTLMGKAQKQGWLGVWLNAEHSLDKDWAVKRGVDWDNLYIVEPYDGYFGRPPKLDDKGRPTTPPSRSSAENLCDETEKLIKRLHNRDHDKPIFLVVDSVTALITAKELETDIADGNLPTKMALSVFMSGLLKRWVGLFQTHNVVAIFINQLRVNPMQKFGNPETTPGGKALRFYCHVRVRVGRAGDTKSRMMDHGKQVGIKSIIKNKKNKVGGIENSVCGFKMFFDGSSEFLAAEDIKIEGEE